MEKGIHLGIVTPDNEVLNMQVDYVSAPGIAGEFGVLPGHVPMLAALKTGCVSYKDKDKTARAFVSGGFCEVSGNRVTVLAESSELAADIDVARATEAMHRAERRLREKDAQLDEDRAKTALYRAIVRLQVSRDQPRGI